MLCRPGHLAPFEAACLLTTGTETLVPDLQWWGSMVASVWCR